MDTAFAVRRHQLDVMREAALSTSERGFVEGGWDMGRRLRTVAYLSDPTVAENAAPLRHQKALVDGWAAEAGIRSPITYLIDSGRRDYPAVYGHGLKRLIGYARRGVDVVLVESVDRFAEDPAMAMRAAVMLAQCGVSVCEVALQAMMPRSDRLLSKGEGGFARAGSRAASAAFPLSLLS